LRCLGPEQHNGNVTTDEIGEVTIALADYFQAPNRDFRYQLHPQVFASTPAEN